MTTDRSDIVTVAINCVKMQHFYNKFIIRSCRDNNLL